VTSPGPPNIVSTAISTANPVPMPDTEAGWLARTVRPDSELRNGDILIEVGENLRAGSLVLRDLSLLPGWAVVATDSPSSFGREMRDAGWVFFLMAGRVKATGTRFEESMALKRAITKLAATATLQNCNALEITEITRSRFLGVSRVGISAHVRHVQKGAFFHGR
jgi:hypothetical protein